MRILRALLPAAVAAVLIGGCTPAGSVASYPHYATGAELVAAADLVIRATALDSRDDTLYPDVSTSGDPAVNPQAGLPADEAAAAREAGGVPVTVTRVRVAEVLRGDARVGDVLEVSRLRNEVGTAPLATGTEYALLLASFGAGVPHTPLNPAQGVLEVRGGDLRTVAEGAEPTFATLDALRTAAAAN